MTRMSSPVSTRAMSSSKLPDWSGPMIRIFGGSESGSRSAMPMLLSDAWRLARSSRHACRRSRGAGSLNGTRATTSTTIRVPKAVRDEIGALAAAEHLTLDEILRRLVRAERQRRRGAELAAQETTSTERAIIAVGLATVDQHARR